MMLVAYGPGVARWAYWGVECMNRPAARRDPGRAWLRDRFSDNEDAPGLTEQGRIHRLHWADISAGMAPDRDVCFETKTPALLLTGGPAEKEMGHD